MNTNLFKRTISAFILLIILFIILNVQDLYFIIFLCILYIISCYEWKKLSTNFLHIFIGWFFLLISMYSVHEIKNINNNNDLFYFVLLLCIGTDLGGYIFGKFFGGPKLTSISPNKTYSGSIGSIILSVLFILLLRNFFEIEFLSYLNYNIHLFILIIFLSIVSQCGDLLISYFKRKSGVKNTGFLIPGHGGVLDRIDGMIFVFPTFYTIYIYLIK